MMKRPQFRLACGAALARLETELLPELSYHCAAHTRSEVLVFARRLARLEGVSGEDRRLLLLAACYHDLSMTALRTVDRSAYQAVRSEHEAAAARLAADELPRFGYGPAAVATVQRLILATRSGYAPQDLLEGIIRDADMSSIGQGVNTYWRRADDLRREWESFGVFPGEPDWLDQQLRLLEKHRFHTPSAQRLFDANRLASAASVRAAIEQRRAAATPLAVAVRRASESDTPAMLEVTRMIWGGGDYLPYVWAEWLADPQGKLVVAEAGGQVVGLAKLSRLSDQDWWLEGLRVDPRFQGRGVGGQMHAALVQAWQEEGGGALRLATSAHRYAVHRMCERLGFERVAEFLYFYYKGMPPIQQAAVGEELFTPLEDGQVDTAVQFALDSPLLALSAGLIDLGWQYAPPRAEYLRQAVGEGMAWWWRGGRGLALARSDMEEPPPAFMLQAVVCALEDLADLLVDLRRLAAARGYAVLGWMAPVDTAVRQAALQAGYSLDSETPLWVFAKPHSQNM